jgi:hypothetical protein
MRGSQDASSTTPVGELALTELPAYGSAPVPVEGLSDCLCKCVMVIGLWWRWFGRRSAWSVC